MPTKILAVGSALGAYTSLFSKVQAIDEKHGKFEVVLCTGDFFAAPDAEDKELEDLLSGKVSVSISTYIMQGLNPIPEKVLKHATMNNGEICSNVFLLEKSNIITTSHKLTIGCFGGKYDPDSTAEPASASPMSTSTFNPANIATFLASSSLPSTSSGIEPSLEATKSATSTSQIDILLTNEWPASINRLSKTSPPSASSGSFLIKQLDDIVKAARPRYHFASSGGDPPLFWEREPYVSESGLISRFVSLGAFGGEAPVGSKKPRWFYAFSISPLTALSSPLPRPANATVSPFAAEARGSKRVLAEETENGGNFIFGNVQTKKPRLADQMAAYKAQSNGADKVLEKPYDGYVCRVCKSTEHFIKDCPEKNATGDTGGKRPPRGYICRACASEGHYIQDCPSAKERQHGQRGGPSKEIAPDECWFCLSNPRLTKHLIVSIGTEVYVTLPKGQLPPTDTDSVSPTSVPGGGHLLLIPIPHYPTLANIPPAQAPALLAEMDTYKRALMVLFAIHGAAAVFFEVSRTTGRGAGGHAHVQCVPVPVSFAPKVEEAFKAYGGMQITWEDDAITALADAREKGQDFFRADLPDGRMLLHVFKPGRPFNLQFGREALAHMLKLTDRADWKACSQTEEQEIRDAQAFKEAFAEHDPSLL